MVATTIIILPCLCVCSCSYGGRRLAESAFLHMRAAPARHSFPYFVSFAYKGLLNRGLRAGPGPCGIRRQTETPPSGSNSSFPIA
uniref:Putative secreted protein n=1 Tax=Anopheles darlingi TaxID=43151 RepID=A0A2M4D774_ANODA